MSSVSVSELPSFNLPKLSDESLIPENHGADACPWLDAYIKFSRKWSPMSYECYHEAVGLFLLSTIAARRVAFNLGRVRFTNLYIALVGRTSIHAKTTVAEIGIETLRKAGCDWLLAPDNSTPQWLVKHMSTTSLPEGYDKLSEEWKERALLRVLTAGQRGWFFDEFGMQVSAMMRREGVMNDFRGLLRKFDDTPERYENATISRGHEVVERPYLALLANLTPADLKPFAHRGAALWGDGYLARFGLVTPPEGELNDGRFPNQERVIPSELFAPLRKWHERLGVPEYQLHNMEEKLQLEILPKPPINIELSQEVFEGYYQYWEGLREIISQSADTDLDGNYSRFPEKALRISAIFASLNNSPRMDLSHWARAQAITERWRASLHELYAQVGAADEAATVSNEEKVLRVIRRKGKLTKREISQFTQLKDEKLLESLNNLMNARKIILAPNGRTDKYDLL